MNSPDQPAPSAPQARSLPELLHQAAANYGERRFALDAETGNTLTFAALRHQAKKIAAALAARLGLRPGDHAALLLPNTLEFLPIYFGIQEAGAIPIPVNARLKAEELAFILADSQARALFVHPRTWEAAAAAVAALPECANLVAVGFPATGIPPGLTPLADLLAQATEPPPPPAPGPEDVAVIIYTSGTTGRPKGAMLTHANILFNIRSTLHGHGFAATDVHLLIVPLFHVTGLNTILPTALQQGAGLVLSGKIDPEDLLEVVARHRCTTFFCVPTTAYLLTSLKALPVHSSELESLRLFAYSGAPMAAATIHKLRALLPRARLHNFFGLTETTSVSTVLPDSQALLRPDSVGLPPPGVELRIVDEADRSLPCGQIGELLIRGGGVLKGYYRRPEASAEALRNGWFHTGDTALLDPEGYLYLRGRKKEMVIVAGENVYPIEVENALCAHPAVLEAAVFGREDAVLGECVHAAVALKPEAAATERELRRFLSGKLASFKLPRTIRILERLPRNASGKILKRSL